MFTKKELLSAIEECEKAPSKYTDCAKLATFYVLYDHLFPEDHGERVEKVIDVHGNTEFLAAISGADASKVWRIMDEVMSTLKGLQPRMYEGILTQIAQSKQ